MVYLLRYVCADMPQFVGKTGLGDLWGAYGVGEGGGGEGKLLAPIQCSTILSLEGVTRTR